MSSLAESSFTHTNIQNDNYRSEAAIGSTKPNHQAFFESKQTKTIHKIFDKDKLLSYDLIIPSKHKAKEDDEKQYGSMKQRRKTLQVKKEKVRLAKREDYEQDDLLDENLLCSRRNSNTNIVGS